MEKMIHLTESEYEELVKQVPVHTRYVFELSFWEDKIKGCPGHTKTRMFGSGSDSAHYITHMVEGLIDQWNNREDYVERVYNRNIWERIINKRIER